MLSLNHKVSSSCNGCALAIHSRVDSLPFMTCTSSGGIIIVGAISLFSSVSSTVSLMNALISSLPSWVFIARALWKKYIVLKY